LNQKKVVIQIIFTNNVGGMHQQRTLMQANFVLALGCCLDIPTLKDMQVTFMGIINKSWPD
jgi:hypothetical protein